ncbi:unnamed protein product [Phaedon cochleariae]|uniref:RNase H type-1 domain-containing protein n=1 Tax=Phaedon cochleariae TaxID=80249 RepID=A0A9P0DV97_PHACE|nr:unnamed protein product [Phaedon cochleariae]
MDVFKGMVTPDKLMLGTEADLVLGDVGLTYERSNFVEFSFITLADSGAFVTHAPSGLNEALALLRPFQWQAIESQEVTSRLEDCKRKLRTLADQDCVKLIWVPGHQGIAGNEKADELSRRGSDNEPDTDSETYSTRGTPTLSYGGLDPYNHVRSIAKAALQKLGFLLRAKSYFTPQQLLMIYKAQIRPVLEYCSHIWGSAPKHTLMLLDSIQRRAIRLVGDATLTHSLTSLEHRRKVGDLSLFYRYFHGKCSSEISAIIPSLAIPIRRTRQAQSAHPFVVYLERCRTALYQDSFTHRTARLWNSLPVEQIDSLVNFPFKVDTSQEKLQIWQLTTINNEKAIHNLYHLEDAMKTRDVKLFVEQHSSSYGLLENGTGIYARLWDLMENRQNGNFLVKSVEEGVKLVRDARNIAVMAGRETLFFDIQRFGVSNFHLSEKLNTAYSAIALQLGCPYTEEINKILMSIFEAGIITKMTENEYEKLGKQKELTSDIAENIEKETSKETRRPLAGNEENEKSKPINLKMLQGSFYLLCFGNAFSGLILFGEIMIHKHHIQYNSKKKRFKTIRRLLKQIRVKCNRMRSAARRFHRNLMHDAFVSTLEYIE